MALDSAILEQYSDPLWRLNHLYLIVDKAGRQIKFEPREAQLKLLANLHGKDIILKARQMGFTTLCCLISLDECLFNPNWSAAIIAHTRDDAKDIFKTKVKHPYDHLPPSLKAELPLTTDSADTLALSNGSSISVKTSARSGTYQRLHISEFGKICAKYPDKAKEIVTGSLPAAERGMVTIESTAEGQEGRFYEMVERAKSRPPRNKKEWKFHFFPWWEESEYIADPEQVVITAEDERYFGELALEGIALTAEQKAWWVLTEKDQGGDMKREYPATPKEAFEQAIEGAIFATQLAHAVKHDRIGSFPIDPRYPVNTFWDLGRNDANTIWLHQRVKERNRFVGYYENSGEYIAHYVDWLRKWGADNDVSFGEHWLPHDGDREDLFLEHGRKGVMEDLNFHPNFVPRVRSKWDAIETARNVFVECDFDEAACALGLKRLRHYRKAWDDRRGVFKNEPLHDENSHGADGFMTFATNYKAPKASTKLPPRRPVSAW